jgi:hypothetical protein
MEVHGVGVQDEHLFLTPKDEQTKKMNLVIKQFIKNYVATDP